MTRTADLGRVLFLSAFLIATCGLVYELVAGALASYLLGDSITWFSLVIGAYLSAMGIGSWLSKYVSGNLVARFVEIEIAIALVGGFEAPVLFAGFTYTPAFRAVLFVMVGLVGMCVGLELPLLIRILEARTTLRELVARVFFLDYIGALAASLLFPLFLVPQLGLLRTSLCVGLINATVALWTTFVFDAPPAVLTRLRGMAGATVVALCVGLSLAGEAEQRMEADLFADPVVYSLQTPYQRIVVTHAETDTRLFIDGALQFSSVDEYRYHEALVHPAMAAGRHDRVLVLGGGDGLAVREILKWNPTVVDLVDLDPAMTTIFRDRPELARLNDSALTDPRVRIHNADAFTWVREARDTWDVAIIDFPDPNNFGLGKLYTRQMYQGVRLRLSPEGWIGVQATSPFFSPSAWSCILATLADSGLDVHPYHAYVPAFGEWGFVLAGRGDPSFARLPDGLRFLDVLTLKGMFNFPPDLAPHPAPVNRLDNQALVQLYEEDWRALGRHP